MPANRYERDDPTEPGEPSGQNDRGTAPRTKPWTGSPASVTEELPADKRLTEPRTARVAAPGSAPDDAVTSTFDVREAERTRRLPRQAGTHPAERPAPRAGLTKPRDEFTERSNADYPTGERPPVSDDEGRSSTEPGAPTKAEPDDEPFPWLTAKPAAGGATTAAAGTATNDQADDVAGDGATVTAAPPSRTGAHLWSVILTLLLTPVAWYLLADAGARLTLPSDNPWQTGVLNVAALIELGAGLAVLAVVLLAARWSSLGVMVTGSLVLILGVPFVAAPAWTQDVLEPAVAWLPRLGGLGGNLAHHLVASGSSGRLVGYGLALILVGVVSHGARRQGRREVRPVAGSA